MLGFARRSVLLGLLAVGVSTVDGETLGAISRLDDVVVDQEMDATTVRVRTSTAPRYHATLIDSPMRLVIDFDATAFAWRKGRMEVDTPPLKQVRASQFDKDVARVVLEFTGAAHYAIRDQRDGLVIVVPKAAKVETVAAFDFEPASTVAAAPAVVQVAQAQPAAPPRRPAEPQTPPAQPPATAPSGPPPNHITPSNGNISLDFKDAEVVNLLRILAAESGKNIVISDDVKGKMSITLRNVPWEQALDIILEARGLEKVERGNVIRIVTRDQLVREREAATRIEEARIKAEQTKATAEVEIRRKAAEASEKEQEVQRRRLQTEAEIAAQQARGPLREETIRLAYADPEELARTLQGLLGIPAEGMAAAPTAPIVPPAGPPFSALYGPPPTPGPAPVAPPEVTANGITIRAHKPTNSLFIRHYEKDLARIKKLIRETLDVRLPQIKIEARLTELNRTDLFDLGVQWGGSGQTTSGDKTLVMRGVASDPNLTQTSVTNTVGSVVNLPIGNIPFGGLGFGIIGTNFSVNLALQALESQSKARSLSRPEIVTVENAKAAISLGSEIPYATVSSAGTQVQFKEAVLKLEVTPTVIREADGTTKIKMKVMIDDNSRGTDVPSGVAGGTLPTINKRHAETEVVVRAGEILVIGGINQRSETETLRKVPTLGDIPVLGWLFKTTSRTLDPDRELVVFLTPTVLNESSAANGSGRSPAR
jgi:type IV pilus assembly protein PilQ